MRSSEARKRFTFKSIYNNPVLTAIANLSLMPCEYPGAVGAEGRDDIGIAASPRHFHAGRSNRHSGDRSEEHTSELQSLMRISYAVFCLKKKNNNNTASNARSS